MEKHIVISVIIWKLATPNKLWAIANQFKVHKSTVGESMQDTLAISG